MASLSTLLCIHRDPAQLAPLQQGGYRLLTATTGNEGLRLFMTRPVDAIVLEYHLGLLDGGFVATQIKMVCPAVPILMLIDHLEVPDGALKSVDMVVAKIDGDDFLLSAVRHVLGEMPASSTGTRGSLPAAQHGPVDDTHMEIVNVRPKREDHSSPFSPEAWQSILDGSVRFGSPQESPRRRN